MKGRRKALFLLPFLLMGCNKVPISSPNSSEQESSSSSESSSEFKQSDSSSILEEFEFDKYYHSDSWDEQVVNLISVAVNKDNALSVPSVNAESFDYYLTNDSQSGIDVAVINCFGINENSIVEEYENALVAKDFMLSSENPYGYKECSLTEDLSVQYELTENINKEVYLQLMIYKAEMRLAEWPEEAIKQITDEKVPVVEGKSYQAFADMTIDYKPRIIIYTYESIFDDREYAQKLIDEGFNVTVSQYYYEATSDLGLHMSFMYDEYEKYFTLIIYNDWPYCDLNYLLGFDLPRLDYEGAEFDYDYIYDNDNYEILTLYYSNVDITSLTLYGESLENIGFSQYGDVSQNQGEYQTTTKAYVKNLDQEEEHYIVLSYSAKLNMLAIAIYY